MTEPHGMRVLVSGGNGFVGSRLVSRLLAEGCLVQCAHRSAGPCGSGAATCVSVDLSAAFGPDVFATPVDAIVHLAAEVRAQADPAQLIATNVVGTAHLLEFARRAGAHTFVFASTGGVYGYRRGPISETSRPKPINLYSLTKYQAENLVFYYSRYLKTIILRLFFPYGPGQVGRLIPSLIKSVGCGQEIELFNSGRNPVINPIHVDDVTDVLVRALGYGRTTVVNVAGEENVSVECLARKIGGLAGRAPAFAHAVDPHMGNLIGDTRRLHALLCCRPRVPLADGLAEMVARG